MLSNIARDYSRFRQIVKGYIKKNLRKFLTGSEMLAKQGNKIVKIPIYNIDLPRFKYGKNQGGVGQGDGEVGEVLGKDFQEGEEGQSPGEAGKDPAEKHDLDIEVTLDELAQMLQEELHLPKIEPKGKKTIKTVKDKYTGIRTVGPNSLLSFKRTYKESLKRQIMHGTYDLNNPVIIPINKDRRYRSWQVKELPESQAVIIYIKDV